MANVAALAIIVRPVPLIAPAAHVNEVFTVTSPAPVSAPDDNVRSARVMFPAIFTVPLLMFTCAALICAPAANACVPPVKLTVPGPLKIELIVWAWLPDNAKVDPAATNIVLLLFPPEFRDSVPSWTSTDPLLEKATPVLLTVTLKAPAPCFTSAPELLNEFTPPVPYACKVPALITVKEPLLLNTPPFICKAPAVQLPVPSFCNMRSRSCVVLLMFNVPVFATMVRPVPLITPALHVNAPVTETSPAPVSTPEFKVRSPSVTFPAKLTVPLLTLRGALTCAPSANAWVPPVTLTVPVPLIFDAVSCVPLLDNPRIVPVASVIELLLLPPPLSESVPA